MSGDAKDLPGSKWSACARPAAFAIGGWGAFLACLAGLQALMGGGALPVLVQAGSGFVMLLLGALIFVRGRGVSDSRPHRVPSLSFATVVAAISVPAIVSGAVVGGWLTIGGVLALGFSLFQLGREFRTQRQPKTGAK